MVFTDNITLVLPISHLIRILINYEIFKTHFSYSITA